MKLLLVVLALLGSHLVTGDVCQTDCLTDYSPVCASNGMTFSNECVLQREACLAGLSFTTAQAGVCSITCPEMCISEYQPVCANNGKTYSNYCALLLDVCQLPESDRGTVAVSKLGECPVVEVPCTEMCPMDFTPVCGSDGRTYSNLCALDREACLTKSPITKASDGECPVVEVPCTEMCPMNYAPVCGSDGKTYSNLCALDREACLTKSPITKASDGECPVVEVPCTEMCPMNYAPVCGSDGKTYSNLCALDREACLTKSPITKASDGECPVVEAPCPDMCPMNYNPVCGSNGRTYSNACILRQSACSLKVEITVLHDGECEETDCPSMCTMNFEPVCGSDGVTYPSLCALDREACLTKSSITMESEGECPTAEVPCPEMCPMDYNPVCGSDWKTYANECTLKQHACSVKAEISVIAFSDCKSVPCNMRCSNEANPVCGSDGVTYTNECLMLLASCEKRRVITSLHAGVCTLADCNMVCTATNEPLCGTNRQTFPSLCHYDAANCKALLTTPPQPLGIAHEGECTQIPGITTLTWEIIREFDANDDQLISFEEFKVLAALRYPAASEEWISKLFSSADANGDGFIDAEEGESISVVEEPSQNQIQPFPIVAVATVASVLGVVLVAMVVAAVILAKKRGFKLTLKDNDSLEDTIPEAPKKLSI